ncbi:MAG: hypothetical protein ACEQSC_00120 [Candidatus Nanopelagicaceae bacterium]
MKNKKIKINILISGLLLSTTILSSKPSVAQDNSRASYYQALCRAEGGVSITEKVIIAGGYSYYVRCKKKGVITLLAVTQRP